MIKNQYKIEKITPIEEIEEIKNLKKEKNLKKIDEQEKLQLLIIFQMVIKIIVLMSMKIFLII